MSEEAPGRNRMAVLWCPDWPVVVWGIPLDEPSAVVVANRVVATSPAARAEGVRLGMRRRDAQRHCPDLGLLERDVEREARRFEPVAAALDELTPLVEIAGPGLLAFPTRGPARFFGGDEAVAERLLSLVRPVVPGDLQPRVGVADGGFAARLAARSKRSRPAPFVVEPGGSPAFLADLPVGVLERPELTEVLERLGIVTLGAFAALDPADVVGRFGAEGRFAHRLASGVDEFPPDLRHPAPERAVTFGFDPPAERIDQCAFAAKALADTLHDGLAADGLACLRVLIEAETELGEVQQRRWRHEGALSPSAVADRARWQLAGWLDQQRLDRARPTRPTGGDAVGFAGAGERSNGIVRLTLVPEEVVAATGRQLGIWGGRSEGAEPVGRAVARLGSMLGPEAVTVPERRGGRGPAEQITLIPAGALDLAEPRSARPDGAPWAGRIPTPSPAVVWPEPMATEVLDDVGAEVVVGGRGELSSAPSTVVVERRRRSIVSWAGPWPADERWWDALGHRRRARLQVVLDDGSAHLLVAEHRAWWIEATYD